MLIPGKNSPTVFKDQLIPFAFHVLVKLGRHFKNGKTPQHTSDIVPCFIRCNKACTATYANKTTVISPPHRLRADLTRTPFRIIMTLSIIKGDTPGYCLYFDWHHRTGPVFRRRLLHFQRHSRQFDLCVADGLKGLSQLDGVHHRGEHLLRHRSADLPEPRDAWADLQPRQQDLRTAEKALQVSIIWIIRRFGRMIHAGMVE